MPTGRKRNLGSPYQLKKILAQYYGGLRQLERQLHESPLGLPQIDLGAIKERVQAAIHFDQGLFDRVLDGETGLSLRNFQSFRVLTFSRPVIHAIRCYTQQSHDRNSMQAQNDSAFIFSL